MAYWLLRVLGPTEVLFALMVAGGLGCLGLLLPVRDDWPLAWPAFLLPVVGIIGLLALVVLRARERDLLAELFPGEELAGRVRELVVGARVLRVRVSVERAARSGPKRFFDARVVVLSTRVADDSLTLHPRGLFDRTWPPPTDSVAKRYWLDAPVCNALAAVPDARIHEGRLELRRGKWCTRERIEAWLAELTTIAAPLLTVDERVAARVATELDPRMQRYDWQGLTTWALSRARALADTIPRNADPAVVVGAAELRGDVALLESLLRTTDHPEALQELAGWARRAKRTDLAPLLAARVGVPPEEAWIALIGALVQLGGREEMAVLYDVLSGAGYPTEVAELAGRAIFAIRARLGHELVGSVAIVDVAGGAVSVTDTAGEGALSRLDLACDAPSTTGRGDT